MKIKILFFLFTTLLFSSTVFAGEFNLVEAVTVNTEVGIKRYNADDGIGFNPISQVKNVIVHSAETKPGKVTIEFIYYKDVKKKISYKKLLEDLDKEKYRAATIQELLSFQTGFKEHPHRKLYCFGTQVNLENLPGLEYCGIYQVSILPPQKGQKEIELFGFSDTMLEPGFVIAAVKLK